MSRSQRRGAAVSVTRTASRPDQPPRGREYRAPMTEHRRALAELARAGDRSLAERTVDPRAAHRRHRAARAAPAVQHRQLDRRAVAHATVAEVGAEVDAWLLPTLASRSRTSTRGRPGRSGCRRARCSRCWTTSGAASPRLRPRRLVFLNGHGGNSCAAQRRLPRAATAPRPADVPRPPRPPARPRRTAARPRSSAWGSTAASTRRR